jgi:hypothetical protein
MNEIALNLLVIFGTSIIAVSIFYFVNQKKKTLEQELRVLADQNGWKIDFIQKPLENVINITAREWTLESIARSEGREASPGSTNWELKTTWFTSRPGSTILIGPRTTQPIIDLQAEKLVTQIMTAALGKDADGLREVAIGSAEFMEHYMVWAQDEERINTFLTPNLQYELLKWTKKSLIIKRTSIGITIELKGETLKTADQIKSFISLGEQII